MSDINTYYDRMSAYGVQFEGTQVGPEYHSQVSSETISLREVSDRGGRITRVRILQERGLCDVSYIHATLADGSIVRVSPDFDSLCVPRRQMKGNMIEWAKEQGVYAKGLGLLDDSNWSVLR